MNQQTFLQFVDSLSGQQVRALSSQVGFSGWETSPLLVLRAALQNSERAHEIWAEAYVEKT